MGRKLFFIIGMLSVIGLSFDQGESSASETARKQTFRKMGAEKEQMALSDPSPCNRPGFIPNPSFQSRTIWATYLVLTNGRALPIQSYIVNECNIIAVLPDGSGSMLSHSQVDLGRTEQYITTEQKARRLSSTVVATGATGEGDVIGVGYYDLGRPAAPAAQGSTETQPQASPQSQGGTSPAPAGGSPAPGGAPRY